MPTRIAALAIAFVLGVMVGITIMFVATNPPSRRGDWGTKVESLEYENTMQKQRIGLLQDEINRMLKERERTDVKPVSPDGLVWDKEMGAWRPAKPGEEPKANQP